MKRIVSGKSESDGSWTFRGGVLHGEGGVSHIFSPRGDYQNFVYKADINISDQGNSGQYFRVAFSNGFPNGYDGFAWLDAEAARRGNRAAFVELDSAGQRAICDAICNEQNAPPKLMRAAQFFARFRDLTAGGFYTAAIGRKDLGYIGNVPLSVFGPPPTDLLKKLGLA